MSAVCEIKVYSGSHGMHGHLCGRKLSGSEDYPELCGLHASTKRRALEKDQQTNARRVEQARELDAFNERMLAASNVLGLKLATQTTQAFTGPDAWTGAKVTGNVIVPLRQLEALASQISEARRLVSKLGDEVQELAERNVFLESELARWHKIDGQAGL